MTLSGSSQLDEAAGVPAFLTSVLEAVMEPDEWIPGRRPREEWFYRRDIGPSSWIKVAGHYDGREGRIITAFPRRRFP